MRVLRHKETKRWARIDGDMHSGFFTGLCDYPVVIPHGISLEDMAKFLPPFLADAYEIVELTVFTEAELVMFVDYCIEKAKLSNRYSNEDIRLSGLQWLKKT